MILLRTHRPHSWAQHEEMKWKKASSVGRRQLSMSCRVARSAAKSIVGYEVGAERKYSGSWACRES